MRRPSAFLNGLSDAQFLAEYWQKQPLLVRGALPSYSPVAEPDDLAGLACEDDVEARLIFERNGRFELERGPFTEETFAELPESHWTLLIQDLDQHIPEVGELLGLLDFLPDFRVDDVMASFAVPHGSVGPHYDQYDVFLLQISGHRSWQVTTRFDSGALRADSELAILSAFEPEQTWVLGPGDMLYLPPGVAHWGVAQDSCVTYSLGCRAPSVADLVRFAAGELLDSLDDEALRYSDVGLGRDEAGAALHPAALRRCEALLAPLVNDRDLWLRKAFGKLVTTPKALFSDESLEDDTLAPAPWVPVTAALRRRKGSRWLLSDTPANPLLFVNGRALSLLPSQLKLAEQLCSSRQPDVNLPGRTNLSGDEQDLLSRLVAHGALELAH